MKTKYRNRINDDDKSNVFCNNYVLIEMDDASIKILQINRLICQGVVKQIVDNQKN